MGLYKREQYFVVVAAALVFVGAVFMLVNVFGDNIMWALWTGFGFAIAGALLYIAIQIQHIQFKRKYTAKESEIKAVVEKDANTKEV